MKNCEQRDLAIDTAKGLLIILVVLGHSGFPYKNYIYWFHMPAFLFISGMLFKEINSLKELIFYIKKRIFRSLSYYILFLLLFSLIEPYFFTIVYDRKYIYNHLIGGRAIGGIHGVFWFITCLLITQVAFAFLNFITKSKIITMVVILICYTLAHIESHYFLVSDKIINYPFNADVALFATMFFGLGYFLKKPIKKALTISKIKLIPVALFINLLCLLPVYMNYVGKLNYVLDMKYSVYNSFLLDLLIPLLYTLAIIVNSYLLNKLKTFSFIGKYSLWIMYLHLPMNYILRKNLIYHWKPAFIIGILGPIALVLLVSLPLRWFQGKSNNNSL